MSNEIDEKVVEMRFENQQFEEGVRTSLNTLEKLKSALKLDGVTDGLFKVGDAVKDCDTKPLADGVEEVKARFSAMEIVAVTALANITNRAVNAGRSVLSALTIDPLKTGLQEYETKINAIQVIKANTMGKNTMEEITAALDELNTYADKTIYNFTQMTSNVGKFVAQGLDVKQATNAIQGMANLAAASGASAQDMSRATYQMSQALGGIIRKIDWNSLRNANMATTTLKETIMDIAKVRDIDIDSMIKKKGTFEDTLEEGWLTGELFTEAMNIYSGIYTDAQLKAKGFNDEQVKRFQEIAKMAEEAATEVKTLTQLWDVLKETAQSGWTQSWEFIIGDFDTAKRDLTKAQVYLSDMINASAEARNKLLEAWAKGGGRDALINSIVNTFKAGLKVVSTAKEGFKEIIPPVTSERLIAITKSLERITKSFILTKKEASMFKDTIKGVVSILDIVLDIAGSALSLVAGFLESGGLRAILDIILLITSAIGRLATKLHDDLRLDTISDAVESVGKALSSIFKAFTSKDALRDGLGEIGNWAIDAINAVLDGLAKAIDFVGKHLSIGDLFAAMLSTGIYMELRAVAENLENLGKKISDAIHNFKTGFLGIKENAKNFADALDIIKKGLNSLVADLNAKTLLKIAAAVVMLTMSINYLADLDTAGFIKGMTGVATAAMILIKAWLKIFNIVSGVKGLFRGVGGASITLIALATAVSILANAIKKLSDIDIYELAKGTAAAYISIMALSKGVGKLAGSKIGVGTSIAILALAKSLKIAAEAVEIFGSMKADKMADGLGGFLVVLGLMTAAVAGLSKLGRKNKIRPATMLSFLAIAEAVKIAAEAVDMLSKIDDPRAVVGLSAFTGIIFEMSLFAALLGKFGSFRSLEGAASMILMAKAMSEAADAFRGFAYYNDDEIINGLIGFGGTLAAMSTVLTVMGKIAGFKSILAAAALVIGSEALGNIADFLSDISGYDWDTINDGLNAMGIALADIAIIEGALGYITGIGGILGGAAIWVGVQGLSDIASFLTDISMLSFEQIDNGIYAMGMSLAALAIIEGGLGYITNIGGILGGAAIWVGVQGLSDISEFLSDIASRPWDEVENGLIAMGIALLEIGTIETAMGYWGNLASLIGGIAIDEVTGSLGKIADALKKFGDMDGDEIGRGLLAMGGALTELAVGGLANALSVFGSFSIKTVAEPLGDLADSMKKWSGVEIPWAIGAQLAMLAAGVAHFNFNGWGSDAIAAVAKPLGDLADSVKKWKGVEIPEGLGKKLKTLAHAINKFVFGDIGAGALESGASGLGAMADAVKKWDGVSIPKGLGTKLTALAEGVKAWTWAFAGNWTIDGAAEPLGQLATTMTMWKDVIIPETLPADLKTLGEALASFNFDFLAGWSLEALVGPLGQLATAIQTFSGIVFPADLETNLTNFETTIHDFANEIAMIDLSNAEKLKTFASAVKTLSDTMSALQPISPETVDSFVNGVQKVANMQVDTTNLEASAQAVSGAVNNLMGNLQDTIAGKQTDMSTSMETALGGLATAVSGKTKDLKNAAGDLVDGMCDKIEGKADDLEDAFDTALDGSPDAVKENRSDFWSAGRYLAAGIESGIGSKSSDIYTACYNLGVSAANAVKKGAQINSPSHITREAGVGIVEGVIYGVRDLESDAMKQAYGFGRNTANAMAEALSTAADLFNIGFDSAPTITPVVDLSMVSSGVAQINGMLNDTPTMGIGANLAAINRNSQMLQNGNSDVVDAVNRLNKKLDNVGGTTNYTTIDGVTYDDGSNVADAVGALVRAVRMEGRS